MPIVRFVFDFNAERLEMVREDLNRKREKTLPKTENSAEGTALLNAGGIVMAKIDTSKIEGYADMTPEQKLAALEAFEYEDNAEELEKQKNALSKANSEAAEWKRKHNALLTEDEKKKQEREDEITRLKEENDTLKKEKTVSDYKARFVAQGYEEALAEDTAKALADGDSAKVFANQNKFLEEYAKKVKADALKNTPKPPAGDGSKGMTLEKLRKLSDAEYNKFATEHPEEYKALYEKGEA